MGHYKAYQTESNEENTRFQFQSIGKRGVFEKVIFFTPLTIDTYNLSLLDYDATRGSYDDLSVTDNGDMPEVLVTVISTIHKFLSSNPRQENLFRRELTGQDSVISNRYFKNLSS